MKCVLCIPVMNCEKYLLKVFNNLLEINKLFDKTSIIFGYDNSYDNSLKLLQDFQNNYKNMDIIVLKNNKKRSKYRTHNLENIRNIMLNLVIRKYSNYEYYIPMDSDNVCSKLINISVLKKHINNSDKWDVLTFNKEDYYDLWALQYDIFVHHFRCFSYNSWPIIYHVKDDITKKINNLNENDYFQVYSAFNGFGIYKIKFLNNSKYDGKKQYYFSSEKIKFMIDYLNKNVKNKYRKIKITNSKENCEHIGLHMSMMNRYNDIKIMITKDILF